MPTIKEEMSAIDLRKYNWYANLNEDDKKELSMWVLMRYCSSTSSKVDDINHFYLNMTNELVNVNFNDLRHYPDLQFRLMQCVGIGSNQFHAWIKPGKRKKSSKGNAKLEEFYLGLYPHLKDDELAMALDSMSEQDVRDMLEDAGIPKNKVKEYLK